VNATGHRWCRIIQCNDTETISDIVKFNNTQNVIRTWDQYSNDAEQNRIEQEFKELGHAYSRKRGFRPKGELLGIEEVAQPLLAFHGYFRDAIRGKNEIFDRRRLYNFAFEGKKARHILFVYALSRAIDERRLELKKKSSESAILVVEEKQLALLRNLRFKQYFIGIVSAVFENILGRKIDPETIAFSPTAAKVANNSLVALVASWSKIVEVVLSFVASQISAEDFSKRFGDEDILVSVAGTVGALLYSQRENLPVGDFLGLLSDS